MSWIQSFDHKFSYFEDLGRIIVWARGKLKRMDRNKLILGTGGRLWSCRI
jgi:hypothetical protein